MNEEEKKPPVETTSGALDMLRRIMKLKRVDEVNAGQAPADSKAEAKVSAEKNRDDYRLTSAESALDKKTLKVRWYNLSQEDKHQYNEYVTKFKPKNLRIQLSTGALTDLPAMLEAQIYTAQSLKLRHDPDYDQYVEARNLRNVAEDWFSFDLSK